ncbi:MAG: hypothetical protein RBU30_26150, partial [Polyangia bacterium]|nr:hypothetical protein [Polyangia bacterium]
VFEEADLLPPRRIALYDGLEELYEVSVNMQLGGIEVDNPAQGEITWYVLDGDVGGVGPEEVRVMGLPGGVSAAVGDMYNPVDNPMNRTINTTVPPQMGVIGVDIDRLDISAALTPLDTALDMTYTAGGDKYWVVYNLVGVNVFRPVVHPKLSSKSWVMQLDADGSGSVTEGDTVRYTIHLENVGTAPGYVTIRDPIPAEFSSWQLVDGAGGVDLSTATELVLENLWLAVGGSADLLLDAVIGPGAAGSTVVNVATWEVESSGAQGSLEGSVLTVTTGSEPDAGLWDSSVPDAQADGGEVLDSGPDSQPGRDVASQTDSQPPSGTAPVGCGCQGVAGPSPGGAFLLVALVLLCLLLQGRSREASRGPLGRLSRLGRGD